MANDSLVIAAVGDCATGLEPPEAIFADVIEPLRNADVRFAQNERVYSERGTFQEQGLSPHARQHPRMAQAFKAVPFEVVGVGSNHLGDYGPEGASDTIETFQKLGIKTIAAGRNIVEARTPAVIEVNGFRVAFIGYVSVLLPQYWATNDRAGATPMRAHSFYEPYEYQPGAPVRIISIPHKQDSELLVDGVRRARQSADFVVVSMHWGVHFIAKPLADYQVTVAHAAIDAGASLVLGHHQHVMQATEHYKGGVIFYGLGNFAFYRGVGHEKKPGSRFLCPAGAYEDKEVYTFEPDPGHVYHSHRHWYEGLIAYVELDKKGIVRATILPTVMNEKAQPQVVDPKSKQFEEFRRFTSWVSDSIEGGLKDVRVSGDRLLLYER